jgi:hypothetical protein
MSARDALVRITSALRAAGLEHMLAGSYASSLHGIPRTTQDFDILIDPDERSVRTLVARLVADDFYASESAAVDAVRRRAMFNVIDNVTGWKSDLVVLPRDEFAQSQWERRESAEILGVDVTVATAEDTILAKLVWARRAGGSERQLGDVAGIVAVQGQALDRAYVESWLARLGVEDLWTRAISGLPPA